MMVLGVREEAPVVSRRPEVPAATGLVVHPVDTCTTLVTTLVTTALHALLHLPFL